MFGISGCATNVLASFNSPFLPGISYAFGAVIATFFGGPISGKNCIIKCQVFPFYQILFIHV